MRNLTWLAVVLLACALVIGCSHKATGAGADEQSKEAHAGKIDVAEKFGLKRYDLGIYTLIVFGILVVVLGKYAWGPVMAGLDKREANLRKAHDDADAARAEAQRALADIQARLSKAKQEVL